VLIADRLEVAPSTLPSRDGWCFGARDGVHLSNVRRLILEHKYNAVLIEGNKARCDQIASNYAGLGAEVVHPLNAFVGYAPSDGLDKLLSAYEIPKTFDFPVSRHHGNSTFG
jgi:hypothetical protein